MSVAYIGLGSNLQQPVLQLEKAIQRLRASDHIQVKKISKFYKSVPLGGMAQPDYVNAVIEISTELKPLELLGILQSIENAQGRVRQERWGPRTLDLDILLYDDEIINRSELIIPHVGLKEREFVVYPLFEIMPELILPGGEVLRELPSCTAKNLQLVERC